MKALLTLSAVLFPAAVSFGADAPPALTPFGTPLVHGQCRDGQCFPRVAGAVQAIPGKLGLGQSGCSQPKAQGRRFMPFGGRFRPFR